LRNPYILLIKGRTKFNCTQKKQNIPINILI